MASRRTTLFDIHLHQIRTAANSLTRDHRSRAWMDAEDRLERDART